MSNTTISTDITFTPNNKYHGQHILSTSQFDRTDIDYFISVATKMKHIVEQQGTIDLLKDKLLTTIFYEPSTRTSSSFQSAMMRLGGKVLNISDISNSSVSKGETLTDTMHCLASYSDIIVMRHPQIGSAKQASSVLNIPLINAGDGAGEHPTQALLDLFTIYSEMNTLDNLTITMCGDLLYGRTVHSLCKILKYYNVRINFISPSFLKVPNELINELQQHNINIYEHDQLSNDILQQTDILYVTRVQKERFTDLEQYILATQSYSIATDTLTHCKQNMRILHPLPRVNEISTDVDSDPRATYFKQMKYGMYMRMALLACVVGRA